MSCTIRQIIIGTKLSIMLSFSFSLISFAQPINGSFIADKTCSMYQSKNQHTNPGGLQTQVNAHYSLFEWLGSKDNPQWYRVQTQASQSPLRWVAASCGHAQFDDNDDPDNNGNGSCSTTKQYGSHVLALSWQAAFCVTHASKPECQAIKHDPTNTEWQSFSLHGLWPNKSSCSTHYGYCSSVTHQPSDFCSYPEMSLNADVKQRLSAVMPSVTYGSCLERHEWWKHGTCENNDPNQFFTLATSLVEDFNQSSFVTDFIQPNIGKRVRVEDAIAAFDESFGKSTHQQLKLKCTGGILVEVDLALPKAVDSHTPLEDLITAGNQIDKGNCGSTFTIYNPDKSE